MCEITFSFKIGEVDSHFVCVISELVKAIKVIIITLHESLDIYTISLPTQQENEKLNDREKGEYIKKKKIRYHRNEKEFT